MRCLMLAMVAGLAVLAAGIRVKDIVEDAGDVGEVVEIDLDSDDAFRRDDLARMLGDLFDDVEFLEALEEQESNREARARGDDAEAEEPVEEEKAVVDAKDQARYNSFIDTFFRRLNSFARSRFDPLSVGLSSKSKKGSAGKQGKSGKSKSKDKKGKSGKGKKSNKKKSGKNDNKKGKKGGGKKKSNRHPKDLNLDEVAQEHEDSIVEEEEEEEEGVMLVEDHEISKREAEVVDVVEITEEDEEEETDLEEEDEEDSPVRVIREAEEESEDSPLEETSRRGKPAKGVNKKNASKKGKKKKNGGKKRKGNKKSGKKDGKKDGKKGSNKKSGKNDKKSKRSAAKGSKTRTSRASVTGIATVRRMGDVKVSNKKGGKEMRAQFTLGPVDLKVSRKFGKGKDVITKEARAVSPELTGKLSIHVAQNGKARMTNFRINRPAIVQVEGSLAKSDKGGKTDNNFMERSIGRFSPVASKRLKAASREILSAGEPKAQADN